jgi:peptidoglycan hydrolase-like protein with peptidoglycan-binding domain
MSGLPHVDDQDAVGSATMNVRRCAPVVVAILMALAGCAGTSGGDAENPLTTTTATATPKPPVTATTAAHKALPTAGRECTELEEPLRLYPGHPLSMANRGKYLEEVQEMQSMLNGAGDGSDCIPEDGDFGPVTRDAVKEFQAANHLTVDGLVGEQTWNQLNLLLSH